MRAPVPLRRQGSSPRKEPWLLPSQEHSPIYSLRRLLELDAADQLFRAAPHRRAGAADRVGQVEVDDRVADRPARLSAEFGRRPWQVDQRIAPAELGKFLDHGGAQLVEAVELELLAGKLADGAQDRPI